MPRAFPRGLRLGLIEPKDAIAAFERRELLLPSFRWQDVWAAEHARGVAVAGVTKLDVLQLFADSLADVLANGKDLRAFRKEIEPLLVKKGYWGDVEIKDPISGEERITRFDPARLGLIYDVNMRQSYAAGRWSRIEAGRARRPFIMYQTMRDERVRASHRPFDGLVLPIDNEFWREHYPPNGWRCRCTAFAVSERDIERYAKAGVKIKRESPEITYREFKNTRTGEINFVPRAVDPGFNHNPGQRPNAGISLREIESGQLGAWSGTGLAPALRLPPPRPADAARLLPKGLGAEAYLAAFLAEFKGPEFVDVVGEALLITDELFKSIDGELKIEKRGREQFVRFIADTIKMPDEVWVLEEDHRAKGKKVIRRRYIARFQIDGQAKPIIGVFEVGADGWRGVTGYQAQTADDADTLINSARRGELVYRRTK
jgi:SPP1 gp7 family putative phage head morphogenesis protein